MIKGVQVLSKENLEIKSEEVISFFDNKCLLQPMMTPIWGIVAKLKMQFNVNIDLSKDLGYDKLGKKILGLFSFKPLGIFLDKSIQNDPRLNFTLSHEIGHLVLHRHLTFNQNDYESLIDTDIDFLTGKKNLVTEKDWIEWQANYFASCFLMPRNTIVQALRNIQNEMGIYRNIGNIYLNDNNSSIKDFNSIKLHLMTIYDVNSINVEIRLDELNLIKDNRMNNLNHFSKFINL